MSFKRKNGQAPAKKDYTKLKTPHTYAIIFFVVIVCWLLTFLIPAGKFSTHIRILTAARLPGPS